LKFIHSYLNATIGSIFAARRADNQQAKSAMTLLELFAYSQIASGSREPPRRAACFDILVERTIEVKSQLLINVAFDTSGENSRAQLRPKCSKGVQGSSALCDFAFCNRHMPPFTVNHSYLSATMGSTFAARRAGK
jgi:hypothetical protein